MRSSPTDAGRWRLSLMLLVAWTGTASAQERPATPPAGEPAFPEVIVQGETGAAETGPADGRGGVGSLFAPTPTAGYAARDSVTGAKIVLPPLDYPGSVQVIPRELMEDQGADRLENVLRDVSGVGPSIGGSGGRTDDLLIRGFRVQGNSDDFRKNGFRDSSRVERDLSNVERIEILKGPAAVLYGGSGEPAGVVNFITKSPLEERRQECDARFGSFGNYRFTLDSTGPLRNDAPLYYRLNLAEQDSDSFRDFVFKERFFAAPVVRWDIDDRTQFTVEGEFLTDHRMTDRGLPLYKGSFTAAPRSRFLGEPTDAAQFHDGQIAATLVHEFPNQWTVRTGWVSNWSNETRLSAEPQRFVGNTANLQRRRMFQQALDQNHYWIADFARDAELAGLNHRLLWGTELGTTARDDFSLQGNGTNINLFNPVYGLPQPALKQARYQPFDRGQYGLYGQDLIELTPRLKALAGVRQDWVHATSLDTAVGPASITQDESALSPRFGLIYQLVPQTVASYVSYSQSFAPASGRSFAGVPFQAESGECCETGLKFDLLDQQLTATLAGFKILRNNVLVSDPVNPNYSLQVGEAESQGLEFDLAGKLTDRLSLLAQTAYLDARVIADADPELLGNRLPNVPYFSTSIWARCNLLDQCCRKLDAGLGVTYVGQRAGDIENAYVLPSYWRCDAETSYWIGRLRLSLYAENLFDAFYIASSRSDVWNTPGAPLTFQGRATLVF